MALFSIKDQIEGQLKGELKKHPEVVQGLEKIDKGCKAVEGVLKRFTPAEIHAILVALNNMFGKKFTDAELMSAAAEIAEIPAGLHLIEGAIEKAEAKLKS